MYIRIISTPPGEAPEWVRTTWVGITLPLAVPGVRAIDTMGVLSRPKTWIGSFFAQVTGRTQREQGYIVNAYQAVEILATHSPAIANWWRENAASAISPGMYLLFPAENCQQVKL
jgi:hypothetical protein